MHVMHGLHLETSTQHMNIMKTIAQPKVARSEDAERLIQFKMRESLVRQVRVRAAALGLNPSQALALILAEYFDAEAVQKSRRAS